MADDLTESISELNKEAGKAFYILVFDNHMYANTRMYDINKFMESEDTLLNFIDDAENFNVYYGLVLDPSVLPAEIPKEVKDESSYSGCELFMLKYDNYTSVDVQDTYGDDIERVARDIESAIADDALNIDDFSVIYGKKVELTVQIKSAGSTLMNKGMVMVK